jgi:putative SOS response-associated peptidase YedK
VCGRYAASARPDELVEEFEVEELPIEAELTADFNVAPTKPAPVIVSRVPRRLRGSTDARPVRQLRVMIWGLVPGWSNGPSGRSAPMINARAETVFERPAYRRAVLTRRALVPADGWYEWRRTAVPGRRTPSKTPFFISRTDGRRMAMAGLYEFWKNPTAAPEDPTAWLSTFAVVTTAADPALAHIHDRMPVVLEPDAWAAWLDPGLDDRGEIGALLVARGGPPRFVAVPVAPLVGNVANNGPQLITPVDDPQPETLL